MIISNALYSIVIVEEKINKKNMYLWQNLEYSLIYTGDADKFKAEGINTNAVSDFEVINEKVEIETIHKENEIPTMNYKIIYTMKPVRSGKLKIPQLEARYYNIERGNSLIPKEQMIDEYNIRVFNFWFLLIIIGQWIIIVLIAFLIYKFVKDQYKLNNNNFKNKKMNN
ncbi:BatD family protein [uncultured Brachyspira sp.]|uniref:BatD family protein n=1 Tax=uncultured Brachyspira sp. TaxID=221953 RepID=UPI0025D3C47F|nr:BatD family protein [uncultured Brachyspira sp.]